MENSPKRVSGYGSSSVRQLMCNCGDWEKLRWCMHCLPPRTSASWWMRTSHSTGRHLLIELAVSIWKLMRRTVL